MGTLLVTEASVCVNVPNVTSYDVDQPGVIATISWLQVCQPTTTTPGLYRSAYSGVETKKTAQTKYLWFIVPDAASSFVS